MPRLSLLVARRLRDRADTLSLGTATLISPALALTALHVLCPVGPGRVVPKASEIGPILVRILAPRAEIACPARLVWPPAGAPAHAGAGDLALLALDNAVIAPGLDPLPSKEVAAFVSARGLLAMQEDHERLTLGLETAPDLANQTEWKFVGFPALAKELFESTLASLGSGAALALQLPRLAAVPVLTPSQDLGYLIAQSPSLAFGRLPAPEDHSQNLLGGMSGSALYRVYEGGGVTRACLVGVASQADPQGAVDILQFTPIPARNDPQAAEFWRLILSDASVLRSPYQQALDSLIFLSRHQEVSLYHRGYHGEPQAPAAPATAQAYVFGFVSGRRDEPNLLCERLQVESFEPRPPLAPPFFDMREMSVPSPPQRIRFEDGDQAWALIVGRFAELYEADPRAPDAADNSVAGRIARCRAPRVLIFIVDPEDVFESDLSSTEWARVIVGELFESVSRWAAVPTTPPSGRTFQRANPLVVLFGVVDVGDSQNPRRFLKSARKLFDEVARPPNLRCAFLPNPPGKISRQAFDSWYRDNVDPVDAKGLMKRILVRIADFDQPTDEVFSQSIKKAVSDLLNA